MNLVYISVAFLLILIFLQTPVHTDGDSIYKGEPEPVQIDRLRHFSFFLVCVFAFFCAVLDAKQFPSSEEILVVIAIVVIEGRLLIKKERTEPAPPLPVDQNVETGRTADILALCEQHLRAGVKAQTFHIPRWLTRNEFLALRQKLMLQNFGVRYTFLSRFTNRPMLTMFLIHVWYE